MVVWRAILGVVLGSCCCVAAAWANPVAPTEACSRGTVRTGKAVDGYVCPPAHASISDEREAHPSLIGRIGVRYSSAEGLMAMTQVSLTDFPGRRHTLTASLEHGTGRFAQSLAALRLRAPSLSRIPLWVGLDAIAGQRRTPFATYDEQSVAPSLGYTFGQTAGVSLAYTLRRRDASAGTLGSTGGPAPTSEAGRRRGRTGLVTGRVAYDTRNDRLFPSSGQHHVLSAEAASEALGTDSGLSHRRVEIDLRYWRPLPMGLVLKANLALGWVAGGDADSRVPLEERYYPGGMDSVRGFAPHSLVPTVSVLDSNDPFGQVEDFPIGGNKQATVKLELELPPLHRSNIRTVVFMDAGGAFDEGEPLLFLGRPAYEKPEAYLMGSDRPVRPWLGLYYAVGFGFRWLSPLGPVRLEWAFPVTKRAPRDRSVIFELSVDCLPSSP